MNPALRTSLRIVTWVFALALVALPVVAVVNGWIGSDRWPLRTLRVTDGLERVDTDKLRDTLLPYAGKGYFAVRLADAQTAVSRLPWVEHVEVRKHWPDVLEVRVIEHRPFARWGDGRLLSEQGRLFPADGVDVPKDLPMLAGPDTRVADVVALYNESRELFAPGGFGVQRLALDNRGSWLLRLSNGTDVVIGNQEARLRLKRFARMLPKLLAQNLLPLQKADLRYTNGFALVWAEPGIANAGKTADPAVDRDSLALGASPRRGPHGPFDAPAFNSRKAGLHPSRFPIPGSHT